MKLFTLSCLLFISASSSMASTELARSINEFSVDFLKQATSQENVFFSSASIATAFAMLLAGAKGDTADQLKRSFKLDCVSDVNGQFGALLDILKPQEASNSTYELNLANKLVISDAMTVLEQFKNFIETKYKASVDLVDLANDGAKAAQDINTWVSEQTRGMIKKVLDEPLDGRTKMVVINAIYFKGTWEKKFDVVDTKKDTFYGIEENQVDFMYKKLRIRALEDKSKNVTVLELPYIGDASMVIFLPDANDGLASLVSSSSSTELEDMITKMTERSRDEAYVYMPKFKLETKYDLKAMLSDLGVDDLFNPMKADLSGVNGRGGLFVSDALHKAVVEVDEEGTKAAAVTMVMVRKNAYISIREPPVYRVNRPFLFFIRDHATGINLFTGTITKL
ncbi:Leukocyte elastase inhibitor [Halotydeus destructor]|nr:Leukocyte elastase inhibitor [Halotydeus destructor]